MNRVNCKKIDRENKCHHPLIKDKIFLWFKERPYCKLYLPPEEHVDLEGNVSYDDICKYQDKCKK